MRAAVAPLAEPSEMHLQAEAVAIEAQRGVHVRDGHARVEEAGDAHQSPKRMVGWYITACGHPRPAPAGTARARAGARACRRPRRAVEPAAAARLSAHAQRQRLPARPPHAAGLRLGRRARPRPGSSARSNWPARACRTSARSCSATCTPTTRAWPASSSSARAASCCASKGRTRTSTGCASRRSTAPSARRSRGVHGIPERRARGDDRHARWPTTACSRARPRTRCCAPATRSRAGRSSPPPATRRTSWRSGTARA